MKHIKNFFCNQFIWYTTMAIISIILCICAIISHEDFLAFCWGVIALGDIVIAWLNKDKNEEE